MHPTKLAPLVVIFLTASLAVGNCCSNANSTEPSCEETLSREKRFLTFPVNGGLAKIVLGGVFPTRFHHNLMRSLNAAVNLQANYRIPEKIVWPVPEHVFRQRLNDEEFSDSSRPQLYQLLERMVNTWGRNGRDCLLRTICEVAETPLGHNGMFGEILDVVFTPSESDAMDNEYKLARKYGLHGVNCTKVFKECPYGHGLLDLISKIHPIQFR